MINYTIRSLEGYTDKIGDLVSMLEHTRAVTLSEVAHFSQWELDHVSDQDTNSIGALLLHIASIEAVHQVISFENRDFNEDEQLKWGAALQLGESAKKQIRGNDISYYLSVLSDVRKDTLKQLKTRNDQWLYEEKCWFNGIAHNYYYLWYHVMEDEINHRGQIRILKKQLQHKS